MSQTFQTGGKATWNISDLFKEKHIQTHKKVNQSLQTSAIKVLIFVTALTHALTHY